MAVVHGAHLPQGMWDLPGPGIESVSPALAKGFSTTGPPGKSQGLVLRELVTVVFWRSEACLIIYWLVGSWLRRKRKK